MNEHYSQIGYDKIQAIVEVILGDPSRDYTHYEITLAFCCRKAND